MADPTAPVERTAYLVSEEGVKPVRFVCKGDRCTNVDELELTPGAWLDFGDGLIMGVDELQGQVGPSSRGS